MKIPKVYSDLLYLSLLMRKQHIKLGCRISIKMASQPCGGTIANTVRAFTADLSLIIDLVNIFYVIIFPAFIFLWKYIMLFNLAVNVITVLACLVLCHHR